MKVKSESEVAQSCPTLSHPMDCSLPGSSVHGIFQARALEWGAIAFSEGPLLEGLKNSSPAFFFFFILRDAQEHSIQWRKLPWQGNKPEVLLTDFHQLFWGERRVIPFIGHFS